jgi:hypothetical protein
VYLDAFDELSVGNGTVAVVVKSIEDVHQSQLWGSAATTTTTTAAATTTTTAAATTTTTAATDIMTKNVLLEQNKRILGLDAPLKPACACNIHQHQQTQRKTSKQQLEIGTTPVRDILILGIAGLALGFQNLLLACFVRFC